MAHDSNRDDDSSRVPWWKKTVVYQIYPRSFQDTTGNGKGDIQGIISRLDYLKTLGVETLWISPFFASPQRDFGYDVSDYFKIAPEYGTMADCEQLIEEIHQRDMKIVLDLVLNHTSDQHTWFQESRSSKDNPKRDWYIWRDGKKPGGKSPPNNWQSMTSGSGWHYDETTGQWYWAAFLDFQPDLNYRNPEVKEAMFDVVRYWLEKGVDGYRLDIIGSVYEDFEFRDNPRTWQFLPTNDERGMLFRSAEMTLNHPDNYQLVKELRDIVDGYSPPRFLVGEVFGQYKQMVKYCGGEQYDGLHTVFLFETMKTQFTKSGYTKLIQEFENHFPDPLIPTWVFSNHDRYRNIKKLEDDTVKAKLQAALQLTLRGVPYIYYGEEIGMHHVNIPFSESKDAVSFDFKKYPGFITSILMNLTDGAVNRDGCRTPMQWNDQPQAGFSDNSDTWLPVGETYREFNVDAEMMDPYSVLSCYQRFLKLRANSPALHSGSLQVTDTTEKNVLKYTRRYGTEVMTIVANFSKESNDTRLDKIGDQKLVISSYFDQTTANLPNDGGTVTLLPYELAIFKL